MWPMANKRWSCGVESHSGVNAPERIRTNDWRRVCAPCSELSGKIVYRVCVSTERKRQQKAAKKAEENRIAVAERAAQRAVVRARRLSQREIREASWEMFGTNVRDIYKELARQFSMKREELGGTRQPVFDLGRPLADSVVMRWSDDLNAYSTVIRPVCSRAVFEVHVGDRFACHFIPQAGRGQRLLEGLLWVYCHPRGAVQGPRQRSEVAAAGVFEPGGGNRSLERR